MSVKTRKKLIEVALPLEAINEESSRRKRKAPGGYPTAIQKWWAQRPIAACRAVLFASVVDDPSSRPDEFPTEESQERERQRLFRFMEELIRWENSNDERVLAKAREEIRQGAGGVLPTVLDPFCGGGSIPLEAQRLGLEARGTDLNPVAVLVTKALVEIPPKFASRPPVNPTSSALLGHGGTWVRAHGLAEDVRHYGRWICEEGFKRIGSLYPRVDQLDGSSASVVAWLWARTVTCPNPACGARMPLSSSFVLSTKKGKEWHVKPVIEEKNVRFEVHRGKDAPRPAKIGRGATFRCLVCDQTANESHIKAEGVANRLGAQLVAIVAEGANGRVFLSPTLEQAELAATAQPEWAPEAELPFDPRNVWCTLYGVKTYGDLFTPRQLVSLTTFGKLIDESRERICADGGDSAYADAVVTYLALALSRVAHYGSSNCTWLPKDSAIARTFTRQAIPMVWDYAEGNPFGKSSSSFLHCVDVIARCVEELPASRESTAEQLDAVALAPGDGSYLVCTDPPYYDNIGYADLADFFYVWLRRSVASVYPDLFSTLLTPKNQEMVANPYRFDGDRERAQRFFEDRLREAFVRMREVHDPRFPMTLFYAFKQAENQDVVGVSSTGWETMLTGLLESGFAVTGTWPMRTEGDNRQIGIGTNALASSILLVCRPRSVDAGLATRRDFVAALNAELRDALRMLQHGNVAPVDLAQAAIGPGMAIYSRYARVVDADGSKLSVRDALALINQTLDEMLAEQEGEVDGDTRWAIAWFDQYGFSEGGFGVAETLSRAKNTSIGGLVEAGIVKAGRGKVRLLRPDELQEGWDPVRDRRLTVWEATHHLVQALNEGEQAAANLVSSLGGVADVARDLAYRLYALCERKKRAQEALAYNGLVQSWPEILRLAEPRDEQQSFGGNGG